MRTKICCLVMLLGSAFAGAALPPLAESMREMKAILEDPKLTDLLSMAEQIQAIEKNESGYLIRTQRHVLEVEVVSLPVSHPGPIRFELKFGEPRLSRDG